MVRSYGAQDSDTRACRSVVLISGEVNKRPLDIRCDGGTDIGMGHVVRCVALAEMLKDKFDIHFIVQKTDGSVYNFIKDFGYTFHTIDRTKESVIDAQNSLRMFRPGSIVVLDGYNFKTDYQESIRGNQHKLVVIDDLHAWHHVADIVINHAPSVARSDYQSENYTKFLLGLDYTLIRKEFHNFKTNSARSEAISRAIISMGASDVNNMTSKFAEVLLSISVFEEIHILLSSINPHAASIATLKAQNSKRISLHMDLNAQELCKLISNADLMICPASTIALEACCVGVNLLTGYTAANQTDILRGIVTLNMGYNLGNLIEISKESIHQSVTDILSDKNKREKRLQQDIAFKSYPKSKFEEAFCSI